MNTGTAPSLTSPTCEKSAAEPLCSSKTPIIPRSSTGQLSVSSLDTFKTQRHTTYSIVPQRKSWCHTMYPSSSLTRTLISHTHMPHHHLPPPQQALSLYHLCHPLHQRLNLVISPTPPSLLKSCVLHRGSHISPCLVVHPTLSPSPLSPMMTTLPLPVHQPLTIMMTTLTTQLHLPTSPLHPSPLFPHQRHLPIYTSLMTQ